MPRRIPACTAGCSASAGSRCLCSRKNRFRKTDMYSDSVSPTNNGGAKGCWKGRSQKPPSRLLFALSSFPGLVAEDTPTARTTTAAGRGAVSRPNSRCCGRQIHKIKRLSRQALAFCGSPLYRTTICTISRESTIHYRLLEGQLRDCVVKERLISILLASQIAYIPVESSSRHRNMGETRASRASNAPLRTKISLGIKKDAPSAGTRGAGADVQDVYYNI